MKKTFFFIGLFFLFVSCQSNSDSKSLRNNTKKESCLTCHTGMKGFSDNHNPDKIGCSSCHLGNIHSDEKDIAHQSMIKIPGNLSNASKTCGTTACHSGELNRISNSLMTTNSGIVSIDKLAFGEISHSDTFFHIENIKNSAADKHIKNLCFKCHLGYEKKHYAPVSQLSRGGGCLACHLNYKNKPDINDNFHPTLNLNIDNGKCFGCHSRSGRISTNYEGWYEIIKDHREAKDNPIYRILDDGRVFAKTTEDVHHKAGLSCIDCHTSQEVMGDGIKYKHENQAVKIQCIDCHPKSGFNSKSISELDSISIMDYALRKYKYPTNRFIVTAKDSIPLVNTDVEDSLKAFLIGKLNEEKYVLSHSAGNCSKDKVHNNLSCSMCHTSWAPTCLGCHTGYDPDVKLKGGHKGKWFELVDAFGAAKPVMGVEKTGSGYQITPSIPGMIMTLDKSKYQGDKSGMDSIFLRWFAPVSAHTTTKNVRQCESCHLNSQALGFGEGKLTFSVKNKKVAWNFEPDYELSPNDGLPMDAWIGFLERIDRKKTYSGHKNFYPLSFRLQNKILQVGACLKCHKNNDFKEKMINGNYEKMTKSCPKVDFFRL